MGGGLIISVEFFGVDLHCCFSRVIHQISVVYLRNFQIWAIRAPLTTAFFRWSGGHDGADDCGTLLGWGSLPKITRKEDLRSQKHKRNGKEWPVVSPQKLIPHPLQCEDFVAKTDVILPGEFIPALPSKKKWYKMTPFCKSCTGVLLFYSCRLTFP